MADKSKIHTAELGYASRVQPAPKSRLVASASSLTLAHPLRVTSLGSGLLLCELPQLTLLVTKRLSGVAGRNPIK